MSAIALYPGLTLLEAARIAKTVGAYLVTDGKDVRISPIILPGWREVPMVVKITAPDRGYVCTDAQVAA